MSLADLTGFGVGAVIAATAVAWLGGSIPAPFPTEEPPTAAANAPPRRCVEAVRQTGHAEQLEAKTRRLRKITRVSRDQLEAEIGLDLEPPVPLGPWSEERVRADVSSLLDTMGHGTLAALDCEPYPCIGTVVLPTDKRNPHGLLGAFRAAAGKTWPTHVAVEGQVVDAGAVRAQTVRMAFVAERPGRDSPERRRVDWLLDEHARIHRAAVRAIAEDPKR